MFNQIMQKILSLLFTICLLYQKSNAFTINPQPTKFPKMTYNKIYHISYKKSIFQKKPYTFILFKQINKILSTFINNYIDQVYAMGSLPLSFIIVNKLNQSNQTNDILI